MSSSVRRREAPQLLLPANDLSSFARPDKCGHLSLRSPYLRLITVFAELILSKRS